MNARRIEAKNNLLALCENSYPGRGIIAGMDETGESLIQVSWMMGRSENSRNRFYICEDNNLIKTVPVDPKKVTDPSLVIYPAMAQKHLVHDFIYGIGGERLDTLYSVSNGHQTIDVLNNDPLESSMERWEYEPDAPNFTPRITALFKRTHDKSLFTTEMSIIKKSPVSKECCRSYYHPVLQPGYGHCLTTYAGDGNPLPAFEGEPYILPLSGNVMQVADNLWNALNKENRVSIAVKFIKIHKKQIDLAIRNKYVQVDY